MFRVTQPKEAIDKNLGQISVPAEFQTSLWTFSFQDLF